MKRLIRRFLIAAAIGAFVVLALRIARHHPSPASATSAMQTPAPAMPTAHAHDHEKAL